MSTESKTPLTDEVHRLNCKTKVMDEYGALLAHARKLEIILSNSNDSLVNALIREDQNMKAWKASESERLEVKKELAKYKPIAERSGCLMADLEDAKKQKETLTRALAEQSNDAAVDSGAFTYKDWQQIRANLVAKNEKQEAAIKETLQYLRRPDDIKAEYIERLLDNVLKQ